MDEVGCHISEAVKHIIVINSYHSKTLYGRASWLFPSSPFPSVFFPSCRPPPQINSFIPNLFLVLTIMNIEKRAFVCDSFSQLKKKFPYG